MEEKLPSLCFIIDSTHEGFCTMAVNCTHGGSSYFLAFLNFASGVEPAYLFLRASCVLLGCVESLPMSLGTKFYKCCSFQMTLFWLFFGFWSFG
jgi:hypothetical protein